MKRIISLTLCLILCLSLFACNVEETTVESTKESQQTENTSNSATTETTEDTSISATTETTDDTKETQQTEGTKDTHQTENTGSSSDKENQEITTTEPKEIFLSTDDGKMVFPHETITSIVITRDNGYYSFAESIEKPDNEIRLLYSDDIEKVKNAFSYICLGEPVDTYEGNGNYFTVKFYFSNNTYTEILILRNNRLEEISFNGLIYRPENQSEMRLLQDAMCICLHYGDLTLDLTLTDDGKLPLLENEVPMEISFSKNDFKVTYYQEEIINKVVDILGELRLSMVAVEDLPFEPFKGYQYDTAIDILYLRTGIAGFSGAVEYTCRISYGLADGKLYFKLNSLEYTVNSVIFEYYIIDDSQLNLIEQLESYVPDLLIPEE